MKRRFWAVPLVTLLCVLFACNKQNAAAKAPKADVNADIAAINALVEEWVQLYNAEDFERLMSVFYADAPILMSPGASVRQGKEAILLSYRKDAQANIEHVDHSTVEDVRVSDGLAVAWGVDTGTTTPRSGGKPVPYDLKWVMVFERQPDGAWKCLYEIWNDNPVARR
jgi:uncharacterized protein (TIGR02246 family)